MPTTETLQKHTRIIRSVGKIIRSVKFTVAKIKIELGCSVSRSAQCQLNPPHR